MSILVTFHELAEVELYEAAQYYESEVVGLGAAFLAEVERSIEQIQNHPEAAPLILKVVRRKLLRRFPYPRFNHPLPGAQTTFSAITSLSPKGLPSGS